MKKDKKTVKAIVVILVVGIGMFHNADKNSFLIKQLNPVSVSQGNDSDNPESMQVKESKLFIYTKGIIDSCVQHLISRI